MAALFASGRIVDLILLLVIAEAALLLAWRSRTGRGVATGDLVPMLSAGICLMLALRAALVGAAWLWIAPWLFLALLAHLADIARRWNR